MYNFLKEQANYLGRNAAEFTSELVRTPSPSLCEKNIAKIIERKMNELGYDKVVMDDFGNVFGIIYGIDSKPTVLLNSHMDTIMADESPEWQVSPYSGKIRDGRIYGLGTTDCKGGLAVQMYVGHLLKRALLPMRGNLIVAATVLEENGLSLGLQHLISKTLTDMKIKIDYAILGEPTGLGLYYGHDGWVEFEIGISAAASGFLRGDSADANFLQDTANVVLHDLVNVSQENEFPGQPEMMSIKQPEFDHENGNAFILFNRRLLANENADGLAKEFKESLSKISSRSLERNKKDLNFDVRIHEEARRLDNGETVQVRYLRSAWETDPFSPLMDRARQALSSAGCKLQPGKWQLPRLGMGTAGSILTKKFKIPTIGYGPGTEEAAHSPNENVEISNITEAILGTAAIVHSLAGIPVFGWTADLEI